MSYEVTLTLVVTEIDSGKGIARTVSQKAHATHAKGAEAGKIAYDVFTSEMGLLPWTEEVSTVITRNGQERPVKRVIEE